MKVLAVSNRKGGIGKTSLTANIANEIRRVGLVTVLIDMDSQCDLTKIYLDSDHQLLTILDVLGENCTLADACHEVREDLYLIPGSAELDQINLKKSPKLLNQLINKSKELKEAVDIIIIDTPPAINDVVTTAYAAADHVLIVTQPETFGMDNMSMMIDEINRLKHQVNNKLDIIGIAVNKVDSRRNLAKKLQANMKQLFQQYLFGTYISYNTAIPTSQHQQCHVRELGWKSKNVDEFGNLTYEILQRMGMIDDDDQTAAK